MERKENINRGYSPFFVELVSRGLPVTYCGNEEIDNQVEGLLDDNIALLLALSHPTLSDFRGASVLFNKFPQIAKRWIVGPIAWHQNTPINRFVLGGLGLEFFPVVTPHTYEILRQQRKEGRVKIKIPEPKIRKEMDTNYRMNMASCLRNGGIGVIFTQVERESMLYEPKYFPLEPIFYSLKDNLDSFAVWTMAYDISGVPERRKYKKGLNIGVPFSLYPVKPRMASEIMVAAGGNFHEVDRIVYRDMLTVVPKWYGGMTVEEMKIRR